MTTIRTEVAGVTATVRALPILDPATGLHPVLIEWTGAGTTHREVLDGHDLARALAEAGVPGVLTAEQVEALAIAQAEQLDLAGIPVADET